MRKGQQVLSAFNTLSDKVCFRVQALVDRVPFLDAWKVDRSFCVLNLALVLALIVSLGDLLWLVALGIFTNLVLVLWHQRERHIFFLMFLAAFFGFLMVRDTMHRIFYYPKNEGAHLWLTQFLVILTLIGIILGYFALPKLRQKNRVEGRFAGLLGFVTVTFASITDRAPKPQKSLTPDLLRTSAKLIIVLLYPLAVVGILRILMAVDLSDYRQIYSAEFAAQYNSGFFGFLFNYSRKILLITHAFFLATMPSRQDVVRWTMAVGLIPMLSLGIGARGELTLFLLLVLFYVLVRQVMDPNKAWLPRRALRLMGLGGVSLLIIFSVLERLRSVGTSRGLLDFIFNQGVSIRAVENTIIFQDKLPKQNYLLEFAYSGFLARILGLPTPRGNTIAHAEQGSSLTHSLALVVLGPEHYKSGLGTGSSFIAEGYIQWGIFGVLLVATVYGCLIHWIDRYETAEVPGRFLRLLIIPTLLWAPRGSATAFISVVLQPPTVLAVVMFLFFASILYITGSGQKVERIFTILPRSMWATLRRVLPRRLVSNKQERV